MVADVIVLLPNELSGADPLPVGTLKSNADLLSPFPTFLFSLSLNIGQVSLHSKKSFLVPVLTKSYATRLTTTPRHNDQHPNFQPAENYLCICLRRFSKAFNYYRCRLAFLACSFSTDTTIANVQFEFARRGQSWRYHHRGIA
jgi:hypothetical protein